MRSRRISVRRGAGRRRLRRAGWVLGVLALGVVAAAATQSPLLDVDQVTVTGTGTGHTSQQAVLQAAGIDHGDALIGVDVGAAAHRVEQLPWVDRAKVTRHWPSTVRIQVTERSVAAIVQVGDDQAALVDAHGRVLSIEPWAPDQAAAGGDAPLVLTGIRGRMHAGERLSGDARDALEVATALRERVPGVVASVSTNLDADLVDGGTVRFGSTEELEAKVTALKTVLSDVDMACLETLDVRVPGSPALTRDERCS